MEVSIFIPFPYVAEIYFFDFQCCKNSDQYYNTFRVKIRKVYNPNITGEVCIIK